MTSAHRDDLQASIDKFIRDRFKDVDFSKVEILSVDVDEACDQDGSRVLDITIVFKGTPHELARKEPAGFLANLRHHLTGMQEHAFPVVSFRPAVL